MTARDIALVRDLVARTRLQAQRARHEEAVTWHEQQRLERVERRQARKAEGRDRGPGHCVYCGARCRSSVACWKHRDLPALDPKYNRAPAREAA